VKVEPVVPSLSRRGGIEPVVPILSRRGGIGPADLLSREPIKL